MFFIRRRRSRADRFDPVSFRKSAVMVDDKADPFNPRPPTMIERKLNSHNVAPSISSMTGAGMAGAGAYSNHGHGDEQQQQYTDEYAQQQYPVVHQPIQPRQQYTYGQTYEQNNTYEHHASETGHDAEYNGAYSADPQQQDVYAAEAYAYPEEDQVVVSPGMHAQDMGHQQDYHHGQQSDAYGGM